jgi:hypothetical protein
MPRKTNTGVQIETESVSMFKQSGHTSEHEHDDHNIRD